MDHHKHRKFQEVNNVKFLENMREKKSYETEREKSQRM